eukprot:GHVU01234795.1.p1 GENE.GHVU01234795.1~~GHVU01234795.1.p1  ORF type:complete len:529 (-),score=74.17 GHVU01234795.1:305-1891(-)
MCYHRQYLLADPDRHLNLVSLGVDLGYSYRNSPLLPQQQQQQHGSASVAQGGGGGGGGGECEKYGEGEEAALHFRGELSRRFHWFLLSAASASEHPVLSAVRRYVEATADIPAPRFPSNRSSNGRNNAAAIMGHDGVYVYQRPGCQQFGHPSQHQHPFFSAFNCKILGCDVSMGTLDDPGGASRRQSMLLMESSTMLLGESGRLRSGAQGGLLSPPDRDMYSSWYDGGETQCPDPDQHQRCRQCQNYGCTHKYGSIPLLDPCLLNDTPGHERLTQWGASERMNGSMVMFLAVDGVCLGGVALRDRVRPGVGEILTYISQRFHLELWMCTGEKMFPTGSRLALECRIYSSNTAYEAAPLDFLRVVQAHKQAKASEGGVCVLGEGAYAAPAIAAADVGVALGTRSQAAIDAADVVIDRTGTAALEACGQFLRIAEGTASTIARNVVGCYVAALVALPAIVCKGPIPVFSLRGGWLLFVSVLAQLLVVVWNSLALRRRHKMLLRPHTPRVRRMTRSLRTTRSDLRQPLLPR